MKNSASRATLPSCQFHISPATGSLRSCPVSRDGPDPRRDELERLLDQFLLLVEHAPHPRPDAMALIHAPAKQPVVLDRYQRSLVRPVLDQTTIDTAGAVGGYAVKQPTVVGARASKTAACSGRERRR